MAKAETCRKGQEMNGTEYSAQEINELFGLEDVQDTAQGAQDDAQGAEGGADTEDTQEGAQGRTEGAQGVQESTEENTASGQATQENAQEGTQGAQDDAQRNARQAYGRRQRELAQAVQRGKDEVFAALYGHCTDPTTGKPIATEAGYRAYIAQQRQKEAREKLSKAGVQPEGIEALIEEKLKPLRLSAAKNELSAAQARAKQYNERAQQAVTQSLKNIQAAYGYEVTDLREVLEMPTGEAFGDYVKRGIGIEDAFYLANRKEIERARSQRAYRAGAESGAGKAHLSTGQRAAETKSYRASAEEREMFRAFDPTATDAQIDSYYDKNMKKG